MLGMEKRCKTLLRCTLLAGLLTAMTSWAGTNTWTAIGPDGGSVSFIGADAQNPNIVYAGSQWGGLYKSTDGGASWALSMNGIDGLRLIQAFAAHPVTPGVLYLSAQIVDAAGTATTDLFKSSNGGASWTRSSTNLPTSAAQPVQHIAIDPTTSATVYVGGLLGVYKSTDGGATWVQRNTGIAGTSVGALAINVSNPATLYAASVDDGVNVSVYKSTDGAASWTTVSSPGSGSLGGLAIDPWNANIVYIGVLGGFPNADHVYKSTDGGTTWVETSTGLGNDQGFGTKLVIHHPVVSGRLLTTKTTTGDLYITTNGAANWSNASTGLANAHVASLTFAPSLYLAYAGTGRGVFRSTDDGVTWNAAANASLRNTDVAALTIDPTNSAILYAGLSTDFNVLSTPEGNIGGIGSAGVVKSVDGGATWNTANTGLPSSEVVEVVVDPQTPTTLYAAMSGKGIYKSVNGGAQWNAINTGMVGYLSVGGLVMHPQDPNILYTFVSSDGGLNTAHLYKTVDGGANWSVSDTGLVDYAWQLAIDPRSPNTLYAVTRADGPFPVKLFKSVNGAATWVDITNSLSTPFVYDIACDPFNAGTVYLASITGVLKSTDGGSTWTGTSTGVSGVPSAIAFDPATANTLYLSTRAGSSSGVFKSTDGGAQWTALDTGLGIFRNAGPLIVDPQDPATLYVSIGSNGVHHLHQVAPQPGVVQLSASAYSVGEGAGSVAIVIRRTGGSDGAASVQIATGDATATAGSDHTAMTQTVTWAAGDAADKTVSIAAISDSVDEPDETFSITLSSATGASLGSPATATVTIVDDDPAPTTPTTPNSEGKLSGGGAADIYMLLSLLVLATFRMRHRTRALIAPMAAVMLIIPQAYAADVYFGVRAAAADSNVDSNELSTGLQARGSSVTARLDDTDVGESVFGGLWFSRYVGAELGYSRLGEYRATVSGNLSNPTEVVNDAAQLLPPTGDAASLAARFRIPFGQSRVSFMSRVGVAYWEGETKLDISGVREKKNTSGRALLASATLDIAFTPSLHAGVGLDIFRGDRDLVQRQWLLELSWWR